ncbi:MAG: hypothetical protein ACI9O6_000903 [Glaciecola sp.]|jgi:hypothetical protein
MHESIAKSLRKGEQRKADSRLDAFNASAEVKAANGNKFSRPTFNDYKTLVENVEKTYGEYLLLSHRPRSASKKHFEAQIFGIDPDAVSIQNYGKVHTVVLEIHSSRKAIQGKSSFQYHESFIGLHEHFLQRGFQRVDVENTNDLSFIIMPLINYLMHSQLTFGSEERHCYLIIKNYIVVCDIPESLGFQLIFKTVLLQDRMTDYQAEVYKKAMSYLNDYEFVLFFPEADTCHPFNSELVRDYKKQLKNASHLFAES